MKTVQKLMYKVTKITSDLVSKGKEFLKNPLNIQERTTVDGKTTLKKR